MTMTLAIVLLALGAVLSAACAVGVQGIKILLSLLGGGPQGRKARPVLLRLCAVLLGIAGTLLSLGDTVAMVQPDVEVPWSLAVVAGIGVGLASEAVYRWIGTVAPGWLEAINARVLRAIQGGEGSDGG